jgi:hypothetical protein
LKTTHLPNTNNDTENKNKKNNDTENKNNNNYKSDAPTTDPEINNLDKNIYYSLQLDIEEENNADENTTTSHNNRFLHHFLDSYNAKMGAFGNYIRTATENINHTLSQLEITLRNQIDTTLTETEHQYKEFSNKLQHTETTFKDGIETANKTLSKLMDQFDYFKDNQEQHLQTYSICLTQEHKQHEQHLINQINSC